jgi:hypothetical protein
VTTGGPPGSSGGGGSALLPLWEKDRSRPGQYGF